MSYFTIKKYVSVKDNVSSTSEIPEYIRPKGLIKSLKNGGSGGGQG